MDIGKVDRRYGSRVYRLLFDGVLFVSRSGFQLVCQLDVQVERIGIPAC